MCVINSKRDAQMRQCQRVHLRQPAYLLSHSSAVTIYYRNVLDYFSNAARPSTRSELAGVVRDAIKRRRRRQKAYYKRQLLSSFRGCGAHNAQKDTRSLALNLLEARGAWSSAALHQS